jgi:hypothetical protein
MNDHLTLLNFVLEKALEAPNEKRIRIYRGLAAICGDEQEEANLKALAATLEKAERLCREFNFSFVQKHKA